ncbi:unnamed protein product [Parnassius mnemosyne]|uniref:RNase H type-1 domain-containing protein n=1 Tax=Parnassius mnemosyne TaxID=213953 RepID=A0AAV1M718_9NEOP
MTLEQVNNSNLYSSDPLDMFSLNTWVSSINIKTVIKEDLDCIKSAKRCQEINSLKSNVINELNVKYFGWHKLFCNGSKDKCRVGAAYVDSLLGNKCKIKIPNNLTIMSAELIAVNDALVYDGTTDFQKTVVLTDSKSALQHIARCAFGLRGVSIAYHILNEIFKLQCKNCNLVLQWVPSHIGLQGNEEADKLAKLAITQGRECNIDPDYTEILIKYKEKCYALWKEYFDKRSQEKGIWYKTIQSQPPKVPWFN